jgi:hypothetical protein
MVKYGEHLSANNIFAKCSYKSISVGINMNTREAKSQIIKNCNLHCKKVIVFPVPRRDVTNQILLG